MQKKNTSSGGDLEIPIKVINSIFHVIAEPLCYIFNKCISLGYFPSRLKIAQVTPVFKDGETVFLSFQHFRHPMFSMAAINFFQKRPLFALVSSNIR